MNIDLLWQRPTLLVDWGWHQEERGASWSELFYDLIYVCAASTVAEIIEHELDAPHIAYFVLAALSFSSTWSRHNDYTTRIGHGALFTHVLNILHIITVLGVSVNIEQGFEDPRPAVFFLALTRITLMFLYLPPIILIPRARSFLQLICYVMGMDTICLLVGCFTSREVTFALWAFGLSLEYTWAMWAPRVFTYDFIPVHVEYIQERMADLMMLTIGESIVSVSANKPEVFHWRYYACLSSSTVLAFFSAVLYFHLRPNQHWHAARRSKFAGYMWMLLHHALFPSFLLMGAGIKFAMVAAKNPEWGSEPLPYGHVWALCTSCALVYVLCSAIRLTHYAGRYLKGGDADPHKCLKNFWWCWTLFCAAISFVPLVAHISVPVRLVTYLASVSFTNVLVETAITHKIIIDYRNGNYGLAGDFPGEMPDYSNSEEHKDLEQDLEKLEVQADESDALLAVEEAPVPQALTERSALLRRAQTARLVRRTTTSILGNAANDELVGFAS